MIPEEGRKFDSEKNRWELLPIDAVEQVVKILTYGAKKYADNNWQKVEPFEDRYYAALMRHLVAHRMGEKIDPESDQLHLAHAACNALFLLWNELNKNTQK